MLEHLSPSFAEFSSLWREIYRICKPECDIEIHLPYYKSHQYWSDPTHVRVYTPLTFSMLSRRQNHKWIEEGSSNTKLALMLDVDFEVKSSSFVLQSDWQQKVDSGEMSLDDVLAFEKDRWNVVQELAYVLRPIKAHNDKSGN